MRLFKTALVIGLATFTLNATTLKEMIDATLKNNQNLKSLQSLNLAKERSYESVKNPYNPTLIVGAKYLKLDGDVRNVQVGQTSSAFAKISVNLYDGGKSGSLKKQKEYEFKSEKLNSISSTKDTILNLITLFFQTKTTVENIDVLKEKSKALKAQYERIKTKYEIQMATIDEVLKLQSEYESNQYTIEELKYQKEELLQNISLLSGLEVENIDNSKLPNVEDIVLQKSESIKALELSLKAQEENTKIVSSVKRPQIKLEDSYTLYNYDDYNSQVLTDLPDQQNQLMLSLSFNLFDTNSKDKIESSKLIKQSLHEKLNFAKQQEVMKFKLAKKKLETQELKIKSLKSAVEMGNSVYDMIKIKYQNGIVDNITYLDALSKKVYNIALYEQSLNDYEIAKANYYFSSGIDYKKVLKLFN